MNRSEIARSISGASSALAKLKNSLNDSTDCKNYLKNSINKNENNYKGASSSIISQILNKDTKENENCYSGVERKIKTIQSRISDLQYMDRQLALEEERERERERERQQQNNNTRSNNTRSNNTIKR